MNILNLFRKYKLDEIAGIETHISAEMFNAIELWANMRAGYAPWNKEAPACGILQQISGRLGSMVVREIGLEVENDAIAPTMEHLNRNIDKIVDFLALMGSGLIRPIYANGKLQYEAIPLGNYLPLKYDFDGTLTGAVILKRIDDKKKKFLLTEQHNYDGVNHYVISKLYKIDNDILKPAAFTECEQTKDIAPSYVWQKCGRPMIVEFRNHAINNIDGSNTPVALIAGAESIIEKADRQFARMDWEQEAGEKRVFADRDLFYKRRTRDGETEKVVTTKTLNRLITMVDGDGSPNGEKIHDYSPELRTEAQEKYLQAIFKRIEQTINIGKGTVSDLETVQQTATQYSGGRQELFAIIDKIEDEIAAKYETTAEVFAYMASAYGLGKNNAKITITWNDDQTRKDIQQAKQTALQEVSAGVKNKWEYRRDFFGEDEATAKANVPAEPVVNSPFDLM